MEKYFQRITEKNVNTLCQYKSWRKYLFLCFIFLALFFTFAGQVVAGSTSASASVKSFESPSGLTATPVSTTGIDLSWSSVSDAVSYKVYRGGSLVASSTNTSYSDTGLSPGTSYSYTVSSVNALGGESKQSSSISATTQKAAEWTTYVFPPAPSAAPSVAPSPPPSLLSPEAQEIDTNGDEKIDILDFNVLMVNWGATIAGNIADFNNDDIVDIFDFNLLMIHWTS